MTGIELIAKERQEQIEKHGYNADFINENPQYYDGEQLAQMASVLAYPFHYSYDNDDMPENWPEEDISKMLNKDRIGKLTVAGALIAAEIDRLNSSQEAG